MPWEVELIERLDDLWLSAAKPKPTAPQQPAVSARPMSASLFDAVFTPQ